MEDSTCDGQPTVRCNARMADTFLSTEELQALMRQTGLAVGHLMMRCVGKCVCVVGWGGATVDKRITGKTVQCASHTDLPLHPPLLPVVSSITHFSPVCALLNRLMESEETVRLLARELAAMALDTEGRPTVDVPLQVCA